MHFRQHLHFFGGIDNARSSKLLLYAMKASSFVASVLDPTNLNSCEGLAVSILKLGSLSVDVSKSKPVTDSCSNCDFAVVFACLQVHNSNSKHRETKGGTERVRKR